MIAVLIALVFGFQTGDPSSGQKRSEEDLPPFFGEAIIASEYDEFS